MDETPDLTISLAHFAGVKTKEDFEKAIQNIRVTPYRGPKNKRSKNAIKSRSNKER